MPSAAFCSQFLFYLFCFFFILYRLKYRQEFLTFIIGDDTLFTKHNKALRLCSNRLVGVKELKISKTTKS